MPSPKELGLWVAFYVTLALVLAGLKSVIVSPDAGSEFHGIKMCIVVNGTKIWTPLLIVFTANVFALMGLRQLYFLLAHLIDRLVYLKYGIVFILAFIGVKLTLHALHEDEVFFINGGNPLPVPEIDTITSLVVILLAMGFAVVASLITMRRNGISFHEAGASAEDDEPTVVDVTRD